MMNGSVRCKRDAYGRNYKIFFMPEKKVDRD